MKFTFNKSGFHQDVILKEKLNPDWLESNGFSEATTRLEIWTAFMEVQEPAIKRRVMSSVTDPALRPLLSQPDVVEEELDWGAMKIPVGRAYRKESGRRNGRSISVPKQWIEIDGERFLVESIDLAQLQPMLSSLPNWDRDEKGGKRLYAERRPPTPLLRKPGTNSILTASLDRQTESQPGVVLDYEIVIGSMTNLVLAGDTTYYINGAVTVYGDFTIEGGTVVKYNPTNASSLNVFADNVHCQTGPFRAATFTSMHDNTIGATIAGSSVTPFVDSQTFYLTFYYSNQELHHLRMFYGYDPLTTFFGSLTLRDSQFVHNDYPFWFNHTAPCRVRNVLVDDSLNDVFYTSDTDVQAEHLTVNHAANLWYDVWSSTMCLTNSLLVDVASLGNKTPTTNTVIHLPSGTNVFQSVGGGNFYLATNSPYRNAAVDTGYDFSRMTTYPPVVVTNWVSTNYTFAKQAPRDTGFPDLGYHYPPIDWIPYGFAISNAVLTIEPGTVIATYNTSAIWPNSYSTVVAVGTPEDPIWFTRYHLVQEQPLNIGSGPGSGLPFNPYNTNSAARPEATFRFARFSMAADSGFTLHHSGNWSFKSLLVDDCEIYNGSRELGGDASAGAALRNTLLHRGTFSALLSVNNATLTLSNCNFHRVNALKLHDNNVGRAGAYDTVFEDCTFAPVQKKANNGYNAYINCSTNLLPATGSNLILTNAIAWQTGPLGDWYQPTNSPLIDAGSQSAGAVGLYHYTTTTNQESEAGSPVDIGLHYVAVDAATGLPTDSDWDGIPDYLDPDSDGDGLPDPWEIAAFGNLNQNANGDGDFDELTNLQEYQLGTSPTNWDTDGDGLSDSEELTILIDVDHPEWGYLNPLKAISGRKKTSDGNLDADHDGLTNLGELRDYLTDPMNAHTYASGLNDAEYFHMAYLHISGQPPLPPAYQALARGLQVSSGGGQLQFTIREAFANARYDLYFVNNLISSRWQWRRVYSDIICDANGEATITLQQPDPYQGYFVILSAEDKDVDGLTGAGNFDMEFNYCKVRWEAGDVSGGSDGFWIGPGGSSARAGFASGSGFTFEFAGSGIAGAFLDSNLTTGLRYHSFNSAEDGRYVFQFRNGQPLATP